MNRDVDFFLESLNTHCTILRDQCHRALKGNPAYMEPLNLIWSTLDLLTMAAEKAKGNIKAIDKRSETSHVNHPT
jgi:hypothetical protein